MNTMQEQLKEIFDECCIAFCMVKHFRGAPVQGFIKRTECGQLILCMTIRQKRTDIFWFTLFHEIAYVLNGDADKRFVDFSSVKTEIEARADDFARDTLLDKNAYKKFFERRRLFGEHSEKICSKPKRFTLYRHSDNEQNHRRQIGFF